MIYNKRKKGCDKITVNEIRQKLNLSPEEMAEVIGIKRASYYHRMSGKRMWTLPELIRLSQYGDLDIECNGKSYNIIIKEN